MRCPFLQEAEVESCGQSLLRKLIVRKQENQAFERCTTAAHVDCPIYPTHAEGAGLSERCPYLRSSLVQYCSASPVTKFVPYSEELLSRCGRDTFRYCDVYLTIAHPTAPDTPNVDGVLVPQWLLYAPNHMWLDAGEDGLCHVGIDGLLAKVLQSVDRITFLTTRGEQRPAAILTIGGIDLQILFPNALRITATNSYLRANPAKLTTDPYRVGWLFEGTAVGDDPATATAGLLTGGEAATQWMTGEVDRLSHFVHTLTAGPHEDYALMADGGSFSSDLLTHLDRAQTHDLFHAFFSPAVTWESSRGEGAPNECR